MNEPKRESNAIIWWIAGGLVVLALLSNVRLHETGEQPAGDEAKPSETIIASPSYEPSTPVEPPPSMRLTEREKELYRQNPSSRGFTDADREFLREHGVSEDEARAAETILRDHNVN